MLKRCHSDGGGFSNSISKFNIFGNEKTLDTDSDKLKKTNQNIPHEQFKMEGLSLFKVLQKDRILRRLDPKHAYISVALQEISQKDVRFQWPGSLYEFICLCFCPRPTPRIFAKLMKIPTALTRRLNVRLITYLEDMVGGSLEEILISKRLIDFYITESRVCNKLSKIRFQSFS